MNVENMVSTIVEELKKTIFIEVEASGRHIHLSRADLDYLFGTGYQLTKAKDLSQPGQYACKERVDLVGPKGVLKNVVVLGPERKQTQAEISLTDTLTIGIKAPIRISGDIKGTPSFSVSANGKTLELKEGLIVAKRHLHITPEDANRFHVRDQERIKVKVFGDRPLIFEDLEVRVSKDFQTYIHIDYDEANACGFHKGTLAMIVA